MKPTGPGHDPAEVARLARERKVVAIEVLTSLEESGRWTGSTDLVNGEVADEYVVAIDDEHWYVKLYVDGEQVVVNVWSCCWDGAVH